jgi:nucleotide-binding universal stress UspA family protein
MKGVSKRSKKAVLTVACERVKNGPMREMNPPGRAPAPEAFHGENLPLFKTMKTILALIDFSDITRKVLDQALALAKAFGSDIALMHVIPEEPVAVDFAPAPAAPDAEMFNARQRQLFGLRDWIKSHGINATAQQFEGVVVRTLLDQIEQLDPDIVIMGSHGHGALYRLLVGSVTEGVTGMRRGPSSWCPARPPPRKSR